MTSEKVRQINDGETELIRRTTIPVFSNTKQRLANHGTMSTTWDQLLNGLVDNLETLTWENRELKNKVRMLENGN